MCESSKNKQNWASNDEKTTYIDFFGKEWRFLGKVKDLDKMLCEQHAMRFAHEIKRRRRMGGAICAQVKWLKVKTIKRLPRI